MIDPNQLERLSKALAVVIEAAEPMRLKEQADCLLGTKHRNPIQKAIETLRTGQLVPVQQPSEPYAPAQNCLEVPPNILKSGKMLAAMRKSAQPSGGVETCEDIVRGIAGDPCSCGVMHHAITCLPCRCKAAITAYEALRAKEAGNG